MPVKPIRAKPQEYKGIAHGKGGKGGIKADKE